MSLVFVTNGVPIKSVKKHVNFDCFITCLYEGPFFFRMNPFIDYMGPIGI